ncbi:MAG: YtxH domain-containing protein [bacterium]|nr:YtxH domain-containing protein [bacterium]
MNMNDRLYYSKEAERRVQQLHQQRQMTLAFSVLLLGMSMGAALAILFAPRSGSDTRKSLVDGLENAVEGGVGATSGAVEGLQKEFDRLRKDVEERLKHA